nr:hypothetical protein [uncultured Cetobacterium sp.]
MLGLVCMLYEKGMKKGVSSLKSFQQEKVKAAALFNLDYTLNCINFCLENGYIYRVSSAIIPYPDFWEWDKDKELLEKFKKIKKLSSKIRLMIHPDQFVVLNSDRDEVIENSLKILNQQYRLAELLGVSDMIIHIGKKDGVEKFKEIYKNRLSLDLKKILRIENCHYYKVDEVLKLCEDLKISMILDVHHARVTESKDYDVDKIIKTWKKRKPLAHISSGKSFENDRSHSDYISLEDVKKFLWLFEKFDVEVEAKLKEKALKDLSEKLKKFKMV